MLLSGNLRKIQILWFTLTCSPFLWYAEKLKRVFKINVFFWFGSDQ